MQDSVVGNVSTCPHTRTSCETVVCDLLVSIEHALHRSAATLKMCDSHLGDSLNRAAGALTLVTVAASASTVLTTRTWRGHATGKSLGTAPFELTCAVLLLSSCAAVAVIYIVRLRICPDGAGNKSELDVLSVGLAALWWTQLTVLRPSTRRKRQVAEMLTSMPTFRNRTCGRNSPLPADFRSMPDCCEVVVRSADVSLRPALMLPMPQRYWRGRVRLVLKPLTDNDATARTQVMAAGHSVAIDEGVATVVLYDARAQDEAGAELLCAEFTHQSVIRRNQVASAVWQALLYSKVWLILDDAAHFAWTQWLQDWQAVKYIVAGPMFAQLNVADDSPEGHADAARVLWAAMTLEILKYLEEEWLTSNAPPLLALFKDTPNWLQFRQHMAHIARQHVRKVQGYSEVTDRQASRWLPDFQHRVRGVLLKRFDPDAVPAANIN